MTDRPIGDFEIARAMARFGGSFARALGITAQYADPTNLAKLKAAFPELWKEYAEVALLRRREAEKDQS